MRRAATFAVDVEAELALWVFHAEINLPGRRVDALRDEDELVNEFLHAGQHLFLRRQDDLPSGHVDGLPRPIVRTAGQSIEALMQDAHALAHLLQANEIAVITIADRTDRDVELQV